MDADVFRVHTEVEQNHRSVRGLRQILRSLVVVVPRHPVRRLVDLEAVSVQHLAGVY